LPAAAAAAAVAAAAGKIVKLLGVLPECRLCINSAVPHLLLSSTTAVRCVQQLLWCCIGENIGLCYTAHLWSSVLLLLLLLL
jgi:hypothetical protein